MNLKQGTVIWLIELFLVLVLAGDFLIMNSVEMSFGGVIKIILTVIAFVGLFTFTFVFPVLAKFENTVIRTIKNAFLIGVLQFPKTILMMILSVVPTVVFLLFPQIMPIVFLFGFTAPAWLSAKLYSNYFRRLEDQILNENGEAGAGGSTEGEDERIFKDELDESLLDDPRIG